MSPAKVVFLFVCMVCFCSFLIYFLFSDTFLSPEIKNSLHEVWQSFSKILIANGVLLFISIIILPAFVLPVSPLLTLAGIWGETQGLFLSALLGTLCLSLNSCWTYWLARVCGMPFVNRLLALTKLKPIKIPAPENSNFVGWSLILRLTPGVPFIFSNYILGALKMPFHKYLLISIPILTASSFGYIFATAGLVSGNIINFIGGISLIFVIIILGKVIIKKKKNAI